MSAAEVTPIRPDLSPLDELRKPFPAEVVGKLPRVSCGACSKKNCDRHKPAKCAVCGAWITTAHVHLDYVGHAEVTDRLLSADPAWNWEPLAWTEEGFPRFTKGASGELELWIKLTVCGVTRLGVGSVAGNAFDAEKQLIGDALRNAAMRFGVALDLWAKEELESQLPSEDEPKKRPAPPQATATRTRPPAAAQVVDTPALPAGVDADTGEVQTKRRKPPTAPAPQAEEPKPTGRRPEQTTADAETAKLLGDLIEKLKADDALYQKALAAWKKAGLPERAAQHLTQADAEKALEVLGGVWAARS